MDLDRYRRALRDQLQRDTSADGLTGAGLRVPLLARPLGAARPPGSERATRTAEPERPILELLRQPEPRIVLSGRPGAGKSTTLRQYALELVAADAGPLPLLVPLSQLDGGYSDLAQLMLDCMCRVTPGGSLEALARGEWVLLLDGVNEYGGASDPFSRLMANFPRLRMIFTTREPAAQFRHQIELLPLAPADRDALIAAWIPDHVETLRPHIVGDARLDELSRTPLLLALLCDAVREGLAPEGTRAGLIRASVAGHARRYADKVGRTAITPARVDVWLAALACEMLRAGNLHLDELAAEEVLRTAPASPVDPRSQLRHLVEFHLMARSGAGRVEFVHPLILEYYAALHLRASSILSDRRALRRDLLNRTIWTEPIRLFAEECEDPAIAAAIVDVAGDVDAILAARLVGSFPPTLQPALLRRLARVDDNAGTRLTRAFAVATVAVVDELRSLARDGDLEVRFQVVDGLWDLRGPPFAALNASLLADDSLAVVNAAAHNLGRHPAPVDALLAALGRDDVWQTERCYALPHLVTALLQSDTPEAGARACELARLYLTPGSEDQRADMKEPYQTVHGALFTARLSPAVACALAGLLGELDELQTWVLLQMLTHSSEVTRIDRALARLSLDRRDHVLEWALKRPEHFTVSDEALLDAIQTRRRALQHLGDRNPLFVAATERRCRGLVEWLVGMVAGEERDNGWYLGEFALLPLARLDGAVAAQAAWRALSSGDESVRRAAAAALCRCDHPALSQLRVHAMELAAADLELAAELIADRDVDLATTVLERVLGRHARATCEPVLRAFRDRWDLRESIAQLRRDDRHGCIQWPVKMPTALRRGLVRSLLGPEEPTLSERLLGSWLWRDYHDIVVPYLVELVETGSFDVTARAIDRLHSTGWRPPVPTFVRLMREGHSRFTPRPDATPDELFVALRPLLRDPDPGTRRRAVAQLVSPPPGHLEEFVGLLDEPEFALPVAHRIINHRLYAHFPAVLARPGLIVTGRPAVDDAGDASDPLDRFDRQPIDWHTFEHQLREAPLPVLQACLELVAGRDDSAWNAPFLALFARAPEFRHHARVLAAVRCGTSHRGDGPLEALIRCIQTDAEMAVLDRCLDEPEFPSAYLLSTMSEVGAPRIAPFALARLTRHVEQPRGEVSKFVADNDAGWWTTLVRQHGAAEHGARLVELARRASDVWLSQQMYRAAAEIQQRTGFYYPRLTIMPKPWTLLHLSDLHFSDPAQPDRWFSALAEDLRRELAVDRVDAVVLSGDIVDRGRAAGYAAATQFLARLREEFRVTRDHIVIVPGNHDVDRAAAKDAISRVKRGAKGARVDFEVARKHYAITDRDAYQRRLAAFADFFTGALERPYSLDPAEHASVWIWPEIETVVLGLSSVDHLDGIRPDNATIDDASLGRALDRLRADATIHAGYLKLAVFHHPLNSPGDDRLRDANFMDRLAVAGFSLVLHGHVHRSDSALVRYDCRPKGRRIEVVGAGTFGSRAGELPTGYPWQYNLLRVNGDRVRVETRRREADNASWKPHACWTTGPGEAPQAWFELALARE